MSWIIELLGSIIGAVFCFWLIREAFLKAMEDKE